MKYISISLQGDQKQLYLSGPGIGKETCAGEEMGERRRKKKTNTLRSRSSEERKEDLCVVLHCWGGALSVLQKCSCVLPPNSGLTC